MLGCKSCFFVILVSARRRNFIYIVSMLPANSCQGSLVRLSLFSTVGKSELFFISTKISKTFIILRFASLKVMLGYYCVNLLSNF